jgi:hypothetical protein
MKHWPNFNGDGDLPVGIHQATLAEATQHFGAGSLRRETIARRLERIYRFAGSTGQAIIFDNMAAQNIEGAGVFWIRRMAAIGGENAALEHWEIKRNKMRRGIVEVIADAEN